MMCPPTALGEDSLPVVVIGAGFLGARVASEIQRCHPGRVRATTRSGQRPATPMPDGIEVFPLDVVAGDKASLEAAVSDSGSLVISYAPGQTQAREALYVDGTTRLLNALSSSRCRRVVYVSSTSALPNVDGVLDETCDEWPKQERGRVQRAGEAAVQRQCAANGVPWTVLRLGGLYGEGRDLARIYRLRERDPLPGDGWQATNLIHVDDACQSVTAALRLPDDATGVIHVVADDHRPRRELYDTIAHRAGQPPPNWERDAPRDRPPSGKVVDNSRLRSVLGVVLRHPRHAI